jgi:tetratricopeptide (TPR) repeat protein
MMNLQAWRHSVIARFHRFRKRPERAVEEYRKAVRAEPKNVALRFTLAHMLAGMGRHDEAIGGYRNALAQAPNNPSAWFNLGYLCDRQKKIDDAILAFQQAVRLNPKLDRAWYGLGRCFASRGDFSSAAQNLERAAQLQPMNGTAWYELGIAYHWLGKDDKVREVAMHLNRFDRQRTHKLIKDTNRRDLAHLVADFKDLKA